MKTLRLAYGLLAMVAAFNSIQPDTLAQDATSTNVTMASQKPFEKTLREFVSRAAKDSALSALLAKHQITLQYTIADLGVQCYVGFDGKKVVGQFGKPTRPSELVFVSDAKTLDRILRGEDCEMDVTVHLSLLRKLSLRRDLTQIRTALARVYLAVCDDSGNKQMLLAKVEAQ